MQNLTKVSKRWLLTVAYGACATLAAIPSPSAAAGSGEEVIYSDLGKEGDCGPRPFWSEYGKRVLSGPEAVAFSFTPKKAYTVTSVKLLLAYYTKYGPGHTFQVMLDNNVSYYGENTPKNVHLKGSVLARQVTHSANQYFKGCAPQTITFPTAASVAANQTYWIVILASPNTYGGWIATLASKHGEESNSENEGRNWSYAHSYGHPAAFAVYGTPAGN